MKKQLNAMIAGIAAAMMMNAAVTAFFVCALMFAGTAFGVTWRELPRENNTYKIPTREGYTFEGWYLDEEYTVPFDMTGDNASTSRLPSGALVQDQIDAGGITVYAKWKSIPATLLPGRDFNLKVKKLSGQSISSTSTPNSTIKAFQQSLSAPARTMTAANIISASESVYPVYAWFDNDTVWWYSDADDIEMNTDCQEMFHGFAGLTDLDLNAPTA